MTRKKPTATERLDELRAQAQQARVDQRAADVEVEAIARRGVELRDAIVDAHAEDNADAVADLSKQLAAAKAKGEAAQLKARGLAQRVAHRDQAITQFIGAECEALLADLRPEAEKVRDEFDRAVRALLEVERRWQEMVEAHAQILRDSGAPGAPATNLPAQHGFENPIHDLRRAAADRQVVAPVPHWAGKRHAEADEGRKLTLLRKRDEGRAA
jgi:hypothetical protein